MPRHGLRAAEAAADAQRLEGRLDRRLGRQERSRGTSSRVALDDPSGTVPGWVVVYADSFVAAIARGRPGQGRRGVRATPRRSPSRTSSTAARALIADPNGGSLVVDDDGVDGGVRRRPRRRSSTTYTTATVLHFQLEPVNALAFEKDGIWEIHTGNQWQSLILPTLAKALGVGEDKVVMRTYLIGGGFGRRLNGDYAVPAALASKAIGKPVKLVWTRADDALFDSPRSPSVQRVRMAFDAEGKVVAMDHQACAGWPTQVMAAELHAQGHERRAVRSVRDRRRRPLVHGRRAAGAGDLQRPGQRYVPSRLAALGRARAGRIGRWRASSTRQRMRSGIDPVAFRIAMLDAKGRNAGSSPELGRRRAASGERGQACGREGRLGHAAAEGHRAWALPRRSARSATCRPGPPASRACASIAPPASSRSRS